ncbi:hypothetical protein LPJ75_004618 [Coemansia sp. RSA 2598]|nr:hypothetical protein LPJ75_004618 [Coemansia sp. RSA 2598]
MNTLHDFGLSPYPSSSASGAGEQQQQQQQQHQRPEQHQGYPHSQLHPQQQQCSSNASGLQIPISSVAQGMPPFYMNASSSVSPVPNPGEFAYTPQPIVSPTTPTPGIGYGEAYTLSASTTPIAASSRHMPLRQQKQPPRHVGLVDTPLYHSYSYQPASQTAPFQQQQQQQLMPSIMLGGNPITPMASSYQFDSFQQTTAAAAAAASSAAATHGGNQSKPRAPRNKSKFKRFRNAFIYFVNDQR